MTECMGCSTHEGVRDLEIHDLADGDPEKIDLKNYCDACLSRFGIFCERHQAAHVCAEDAADAREIAEIEREIMLESALDAEDGVELEPEDFEGSPHDKSVCPMCALEVTRAIPQDDRDCFVYIMGTCGDLASFRSMAKHFEPFASTILSPADLAVYGLVIAATLYGETVDECLEHVLYEMGTTCPQ